MGHDDKWFIMVGMKISIIKPQMWGFCLELKLNYDGASNIYIKYA